VALARGEPADDGANGAAAGEALVDRARALAQQLASDQRRIRGLYSGGTLCKEAALVLAATLGRPAMARHSLLDLGDDEFTVGRPHPMIDARLRNEMVVQAAADPETAVILLDVVLGYGAHPDPAGALLPALGRRASGRAATGRSSSRRCAAPRPTRRTWGDRRRSSGRPG
jgi:FdrA protein